ncbi:hypothetical protein BC831DRAFT_311781 [Entophlyctis helioformis]|nr:hypothetical protein BC831DRAFT_311781 [Entophlyctis helioformis]
MQGDKAKSEMFKHMYSTIMQQTASSIQQAQTLKDAGNVLFKEGDFLGALDKYQEALELHSTEHTILSNACQAALKLGDLQKAKYMAEMCVSVKPDWSKGWYRKGMVEMKSKMYMEAMRAFQTGLSVAPNDADLQKMYAEATRLAEKATPGMGGMDKQFAGMMMDLQHNSWDVRGWYQENQDVAEQVDLSFLETVTKVPLDVTAALRTRHALIPRASSPSRQKSFTSHALQICRTALRGT